MAPAQANEWIEEKDPANSKKNFAIDRKRGTARARQRRQDAAHQNREGSIRGSAASSESATVFQPLKDRPSRGLQRQGRPSLTSPVDNLQTGKSIPLEPQIDPSPSGLPSRAGPGMNNVPPVGIVPWSVPMERTDARAPIQSLPALPGSPGAQAVRGPNSFHFEVPHPQPLQPPYFVNRAGYYYDIDSQGRKEWVVFPGADPYAPQVRMGDIVPPQYQYRYLDNTANVQSDPSKITRVQIEFKDLWNAPPYNRLYVATDGRLYFRTPDRQNEIQWLVEHTGAREFVRLQPWQLWDPRATFNGVPLDVSGVQPIQGGVVTRTQLDSQDLWGAAPFNRLFVNTRGELFFLDPKETLWLVDDDGQRVTVVVDVGSGVLEYAPTWIPRSVVEIDGLSACQPIFDGTPDIYGAVTRAQIVGQELLGSEKYSWIFHDDNLQLYFIDPWSHLRLNLVADYHSFEVALILNGRLPDWFAAAKIFQVDPGLFEDIGAPVDNQN